MTIPRSVFGPDGADERPWWKRHVVWTGVLVGAAAASGVYYLHARNDPYCQDPDMFPCEVAIPFFAVSGAAVGAGLGYLISRSLGDR